jgi:integrase/recombinase XerC
LYDYAVAARAVTDNPVPAARRSSGFRAARRGLLGHLGRDREHGGGKLVREAKTLPFALDPAQVAVFIADLLTARDRAMALLMLLGGLRASEVRLLPLAAVDFGLRRIAVIGKGGKQRTVPVDAAFFTELASYLRTERPAGCTARECFVVLRGPTTGCALTEAGLRRIFRTHRSRAGTPLVRPHRLRHTYGTELAAAGIDLLVLRDLMGHSSPETTAGYVHLSATTLAKEYAAARSRLES